MVASTAFAEFLREQLAPLNYMKHGSAIDLSFWRAPDRLLDEPEELVRWAQEALAAAHRVAAKRERTAPVRNSGKTST